MRLLIAITLCISLRAIGATWYLDNAATGTGDGTSWANAWQNPTNIVWGGGGVTAGDTLQISGGSYANPLSIGASGTSDSARITIESSREAGHNTLVVLDSITFGGNQWIKLRGAKDTNVALPYGGVMFTNQASLTNNIGLQVTHAHKGTNSNAIFVGGAAGANNTIEWIKIGPVAQETNSASVDCYGLRFNNLTVQSNFAVRGVWFTGVHNDDVNLNDITGTAPEAYDSIRFESCLFEGGGDDGVQWTENGATFIDCYFKGHLAGHFYGHPDHLQLSGSASRYFKLINNVFDANANSIIKAEMLVGEGGTYGNLIVAGNLFYQPRDWTNYDFGEPISFAAWRPNGSVVPNGTNVNQAYQTNCYFLNNTFYYLPSGSGLPWFIGRASPEETAGSGTRSARRIDADNGWFANNLGIDQNYNATNKIPWIWSGDGDGSGGSDTNGIYYSTNEVRWVNNILAGIVKQFEYFNVTNATGEALGMGNVSTMPSVMSTNTYDLRLASTDTVATGTGYNWSTLNSLTNNHPELMRDLFGNSRFRSGVVDIGAFCQTSLGPDTNNLVLWYRFRDDLTDGRATDSSPMAVDGLHYGYVNDQVASNRFPTSITWTNPVTGVITNAAFFNRTNDGWGTYSISGDYVVSTNDAFRSTPNLSVSLWFYYQPHDAASATNYSSIANMRPLGGGYGYEGAWTLGLMGDQFSKLRIYTNNNANAESTIAWASHRISTSGSFQGYSTNWAWLGFTWDKGTLKQYLNGVLVRTTNVQSAVTGGLVTNLTVRGPAGGLTGGFFMVGGDSHNGNPNLTPHDDSGDQLPNHAWFTGGIADLMIYTRTLSDTEMSNNYAQNWSTGGSGGGSSTNSSGIQSFRANTARIGRIIRAQ
ncbi:MAG: hypothetical protein E6R03_01685 [Hyphomicrobiaceae bacterium]|nr:MAG: hypothetical protein E6R03_01685 [Hyphomicrobiaceae bacterium]